MSRHRLTIFLGVLAVALLAAGALMVRPGTSAAQNAVGVGAAPQAGSPQVNATYRGLLPVAHFDISPALRDIAPIPPEQGQLRENEDGDGLPRNPRFPGLPDSVVQRLLGPLVM